AAVSKPSALVNASAVGIYGDRGEEMLDENSPPGKGFLTEVCIEWEREADRAQELGIRVVKVRTGVVLSAEGGALKKMLPPFKLGVAGPLGSGRQWFPWIHIDDIVGIYRHAVSAPAAARALNGVAPGIVTNAEFTKQMGEVLHRPAFVPVPEFALNLLFGEMGVVLLASQRVIPKATLESGYVFKYPELTPALKNLLGG
ncbi:MAG TPA: TIGR01777 family oxidoreductase, partial [Blastocatellia bacterium]|nr:TIGR01777 family oxidoreductase [Blastocatellia bacterium]